MGLNTYKLDSGRGANPLYAQVKELLLKEIKAGTYKVNENIPTEVELQKMFNVSRMTVRLAIDELVTEGYLLRERAKGTRVLQPKVVENLNHITYFSKEMKAKGLEFETKAIEISIVKATPLIAQALQISEGSNVYCLHRVYFVDGEPFAAITSYLPSNLNISVDESTYMHSLYEYLENEKGIVITKAYEDIEVSFSNKQISEDLGIAKGTAVLLRSRRSLDQHGEYVEFVQSYYRSEKYKYSLTYGN